jgi:hypothetical protein
MLTPQPRLHPPAALHAQVSLHVHQCSCSQPASYSISTGVIPRGQSNRGMKLTTHLHPLPRLGIRAATPLHPLYAFTAWTRKISFIPLPRSSMLYCTEIRFHPTLLYAAYAIRANINLSYKFQKFTRSVFYITF